MKTKAQKLSKVKIVVTIIFMIFLIVIVTGSTKILKNPTNVFVVENGALSYEELAEGYVIREEQVLKGEQYKNGMVQIISDNQKAAKGEAVFRYYSNGEEEIMNQIAKLDEEINTALETTKLQLFSSDIISLEEQIEDIVDDIDLSLEDLERTIKDQDFSDFEDFLEEEALLDEEYLNGSDD